MTLEPSLYIYTGGAEPGIKVRLINYPRFPKGCAMIRQQAERLGYKLMHDLEQDTFCMIDPKETKWYSRRKE